MTQRFWRSGGVDRDLDRIAGRAGEARERVRDEEGERAHVRGVADVRGEEAVQRLGGAAADERDEPVQRSRRG